MGSIGKGFSLLLIVILAASSLIMVESAFAQTIPKPSVPEFTVQIVAHPYDVPTTHSIDPFTGQNITHQGYHVENESIEVRIKNQQFTPYVMQVNGSDWTINFYYNIRIRGHFSEDWIELYRASDGYAHQWSDSDYTILSYVLGGDADTILGTKMIKLPAGGQVDFQVEAMIGYVHRVIVGGGAPWYFFGETSGWSNTQTLTLPDTSASASPSPSLSPTFTSTITPSPIGSDSWLNQTSITIILSIIVIAAVATVILVYFKKRKH